MIGLNQVVNVLVMILMAVGEGSYHEKLPDFLFGGKGMKNAVDPMLTTIRQGKNLYRAGRRTKFIGGCRGCRYSVNRCPFNNRLVDFRPGNSMPEVTAWLR